MLKMENLKKLEEHMEPNHHVCIDWRQLSWHNLKLFLYPDAKLSCFLLLNTK